MSVAVCAEINRRLRDLGYIVHEAPGWTTRGVSMNTAFVGGLVHHTATGFGNALPGTGVYDTLFIKGRPDLSPPLCNYAGNADGSFTCGAAGVAQHAGASGGRSMGPLPVSTAFNRRVLGLEIVYPGTQPMRDVQYGAATTWARVVADVVGKGYIECIRAHAETSITGKWDPGYADGKTIDMTAFRAVAREAGHKKPVAHNEEEHMYFLKGGHNLDDCEVYLQTGPFFVGLTAGALEDARKAYKDRGAPYQWITQVELDDLDRRSHALLDKGPLFDLLKEQSALMRDANAALGRLAGPAQP
jgi:hypothetical protein